MSPDRNYRPAPVAVVTGSSAGVGRAVAVALARDGYDVALLARGRERLDSAAREVEAEGGRAMPLPTDVADAEAVFAAADKVASEWGRIDLWVNVAMVTIMSPFERISPDEFRRVTEVTYLGQVHGTMAALRHMKPLNHGTILQVGSALAYRAIPLQSAYCGAKFAIRGFTDSLRCELLHQKSRIRLTAVMLPAVNTPQFDWARNRMSHRLQPVPPIYQPETVAAAIVRAARKAPRETWIGWPSVKTIVGNMIVPGLADRLASSKAWDGQMTGEPAQQDRPDNLFDPPPGDPGSHGRFDRRSASHVQPVSSTVVRAACAGAGLALCAAAAIAVGAAMRPDRARVFYPRLSRRD